MSKSSKATKPYVVEFEHRDRYLYAHAMAEKDSPDLFGETIALNRGVICKVLKTIKEAEEWLLS
jgi:hypothetical protein